MVDDGWMKGEWKSFNYGANWRQGPASDEVNYCIATSTSRRDHETVPYLCWVSETTYWLEADVYVLI